MASRAKLESDLARVKAQYEKLAAKTGAEVYPVSKFRNIVRQMTDLEQRRRKIEQQLRAANPGPAGADGSLTKDIVSRARDGLWYVYRYSHRDALGNFVRKPVGSGFKSRKAAIAAKSNPGLAGSAFKRCVRDVTAKGGAVSPRGVCASAGRKKYGKKRFQKMAAAGRRRAQRKRGNPSESYAEWAAAIPVASWYESGVGAGKSPRYTSAAEAFSFRRRGSLGGAPAKYVRAAKKRFVAGFKRGRGARGKLPRRPNPGADSAAVYEEFHGRPATRERVYKERVHEHVHLADLGELVKLRVAVAGVGVFELEPKGVRVATSEQADKGRRQLYFVGGDQRLTAGLFPGFRDPWKDHVDLGDVVKIWYFTTKDFHQFEPTVYHHKFAEEGGTRPSFHYDTLSERFYITGGSYSVERDGIRN